MTSLEAAGAGRALAKDTPSAGNTAPAGNTALAGKIAPAGNTARTKNMVLRLDPDLAELLATVAEVEGRSVSDVAREAIAALVDARRRDKRFRRLLEDNLARHQRLLDLLQDGP
jgi:predicted transcriptional regulator